MLDDLHRIFMGDQELAFLLEVLFRTAVIYFYTLALMRWIGGRSVAQLSIVEFLLVISIGSAVGDSLFYPDVPLLPAMAAIFLVVLCNKLLDEAILRSARMARLFAGCPKVVVLDGQVHRAQIRREGIGIEELYMKLREKGVTHLGDVRLAVLEANGTLSVLHDRAGDAPLFRPPALPEAALDAALRAETGRHG